MLALVFLYPDINEVDVRLVKESFVWVLAFVQHHNMHTTSDNSNWLSKSWVMVKSQAQLLYCVLLCYAQNCFIICHVFFDSCQQLRNAPYLLFIYLFLKLGFRLTLKLKRFFCSDTQKVIASLCSKNHNTGHVKRLTWCCWWH